MIGRSTTLTAEGRAIRRRLLVGGAAFAGLVLVLMTVSALSRNEVVDGPDGSSHVTTARGVAALFQTLQRVGADPVRLERAVDDDALRRAGAFVVVDPGATGYEPAEVEALRRFVTAGGAVILAGYRDPALAAGLLGEDPVEEGAEAAATAVLVPLTSAPPVGDPAPRSIRPGAGLPVVTVDPGGEAVVVSHALGAGLVHLVIDSSLLVNQRIGNPGNVELAVRLTGTGRVVFDEYRHGYREVALSGLPALPGRWNQVVRLGIVVLATAIIVYGRRLGPAEPRDRRPAPERSLYLDSVARSLRRTRRPVDATAPVRRRAIELVARRAALAPEAAPEAWREAALGLGLTADEVAALLYPTPANLLAADRALARLSGPGALLPTDQEHP